MVKKQQAVDLSADVLTALGLEDIEGVGLEATTAPALAEAAGQGFDLDRTVIIGLGGAGTYCARRAKRKLQERLGTSLHTMRFLYVDSDTASYADHPALAAVERSEKAYIGGAAVSSLVRNPEEHRWILDQIPKGLHPAHYQRIARGQGCGQIRAVGRVALLAAAKSVVRMLLGKAVREVRKIEAGQRQQLEGGQGGEVTSKVSVYIVSSLAGGTGCGSFVDVAMHARSIAGPDSTITGIFMLPETFDEKLGADPGQREVIRANAYAALKELQALQDIYGGASLTVEHAKGQFMTLESGEKLFDFAYLVDYKNEAGASLSKTEDVFEVVARLLLHENGTLFGQAARSAVINMGVNQGVELCPVTGLSRNFSTFSLSTLRIPVERLTNFCSWSSLREVCEDRILQSSLPTQERGQEVRAFLGSHDLEEKGTTDQVQDRLLRKRRGKGTILETLLPGSGSKQSGKAFVGVVDRKKASFDSRGVSDASSVIDANLAGYLGSADAKVAPVREWLDEAVAAWMRDYGARGTKGLLEDLVIACEALRREMVTGSQAWRDSGRKRTLDSYAEAADGLKSMSLMREKLTAKDDFYKAKLVDAFNTYVTQELRTVARDSAIAVYQELQSATAGLLSQADRLIGSTESLSRLLSQRVEALLAEAGREVANFVVEMDVTDADFLESYFESHRVKPEAFFRRVVDASGLGDVYFLKLLSMDHRGIAAEFAGRISSAYAPGARKLNVVEHVAKRYKSKGMATKLNQLFTLCRPLWKTTLPRVDMNYSEFIALGCLPIRAMKGKDPEFPPAILKWKRQFVEAGQSGMTEPVLLPTSAPYEVELVRYTHGARAWYLDDLRGYKRKYEMIAGRNAYPLHLHKALLDVPDLFPERDAPARRAFALGMALGFIAKRGEYYYFNLRETSAAESSARFKVPHHTEWQTVFGGDDNRIIPPNVVGIEFKFARRKPGHAALLAQGRAKAFRALIRNQENVEMIHTGLSEFVSDIGTADAKAMLKAYWNHLDGTRVPATLRKQIKAEADAILEYIGGLE